MKLLSFILCIALVLSGSSWSGLSAVRAAEAGNETDTDSTIDTGSTAVYYGNGYSVAIEVTAKWNNGYNANVTIENTSDKEIRNWELVMTDANPVDNIWNAKKLSQEDGTLKIGNDGWNQDIPKGSSVSFGFQSLTENAAMPAECYLAGDRQDAADEDYQIVFRAINAWEGGCVVETDILNLTDKDIEDWDIAFTWKDIKIADIWNAVIDTENDGSYTITNDTYNSTVPANGKVTFGMRLETGAGELIFPSDARLSRWTGEGNVSNDDKTEEPVDEELRRWNRTMMNMDSDIVQEAVNNVDEPVKVAILDSGVDAMPEIPVVERFNLIEGEDEMTEMYEDATGHGTAVASVMAYHREKEEETGEGTGIEEENGNTYTYQGYTYEYFTEDIEDIDEYLDFDETEEEESVPEDEEDGTGSTDEEDSSMEDDEDEEYGEDPEGTIRLGEFVEEHQADFEGINPNMELYSVRLLDEMNEASVSDVIKGIRWAMENDIKIINISFGTETDSPQLHKVIKEAEKKGILIIAAAGNNGEVQYPAAYDEVVAVGSVDYTGKVDSECENDTYVELTAPGEGVLAVGPFGVETEAAGTSIAAGEVSAVASILWQHDPTVNNRFIRQLLRAGANKSDNTAMGYGIVDCEYSLSIFDDLKATFVDNEEAATDELMEEAGIEENTDELGTEGIVTANWGGKGHLDLITEDRKNIEDYLKILMIGARLPDAPFCNLNDKGIFPAFHGNSKKDKEKNPETSFNYVSGYLYLSRLAGLMPGEYKGNYKGYYSIQSGDYWNKTFSKLGMENIVSSGGINTGAKKLENNKEEFPKSNWKNILRSKLYDESVKKDDIIKSNDGFEDTLMNRSLVVYGMSLHTLTDTFAHSSRGYGKYHNEEKQDDPKENTWCWGPLGRVTYYKKANDNPKARPQRYEAARQAVLNSMDNIKIYKNGKVKVEKSSTMDFSSRKRYLNYLKKHGRSSKNNNGSDCEDIININDYIHYSKVSGKEKPVAIDMSYYKDGFAIKNLWNNIKECKSESKSESKEPAKYFKRIDFDEIKESSSEFGVFEEDVKHEGAKEGARVEVEVCLKGSNGKTKPVLSAYGKKGDKLCFGLNRKLKEKNKYIIKYKLYGQEKETEIDSNTPFEDTEKTDGEHEYLMKSWKHYSGNEESNPVTLSGLIVEAGENGEYGKRIDGVTIRVQYDNGENKQRSCDTGEQGEKGKYSIPGLEPGVYKLTAEKDGYLTATQYLYLNGMSTHYQNMTIALIKYSEGKGTVTGIIRDSVSLEGVPGLSLELRKGFNNTTDDEGMRTGITGNEGKYIFQNIEAGYYCLKIYEKKDKKGRNERGYIDTILNVIVTENSGKKSQDGIISKTLQNSNMRIVLTWNGSVMDLDSHMVGISENFHVYYSYKTYAKNQNKIIAELDVDDTYYYGPETITVYDPKVSFKYYIHNYSGESYSGLSKSNATVYVYKGNSLIDIYHVPSGNGYLWEVFSYDGKNGIITPLMEIKK